MSAVFFIEAHENNNMIEYKELENLESKKEVSSEILDSPVNAFRLRRVMSEIEEEAGWE